MSPSFTRGWGGLAFLPLVVTCLVFQLGLSHGFPHRGDGPRTGLVLVGVAVGVWLLGRRLNHGSASWRDARHSLCMVPLEVYGIALGEAGIFLGAGTLLATV